MARQIRRACEGTAPIYCRTRIYEKLLVFVDHCRDFCLKNVWIYYGWVPMRVFHSVFALYLKKIFLIVNLSLFKSCKTKFFFYNILTSLNVCDVRMAIVFVGEVYVGGLVWGGDEREDKAGVKCWHRTNIYFTVFNIIRSTWFFFNVSNYKFLGSILY